MKKNLFYAMALLAGIAMTSCGGSNNASNSSSSESSTAATEETTSNETAKETAPSSSHLATLPLDQVILPSEIKDAVEIIPEDDGNLYVDFSDLKYPEISITFKLLKQVNTSSLLGSTKQMWIVGRAQDSKGRDIKELNCDYNEWRTSDSDGSQFKEFLEGEVDNTITMTFTGDNNVELFEKDQAKIEEGENITTEACKKFAKFKLLISH